MLYNNFKFLCQYIKKTQKAVLADLKLSEGSAWQWKTRKTAKPSTLLILSNYFSQKLNIPPEEFEEGQALLKNDFRKKVEHFLHTDSNTSNSTHTNDQILSNKERNLPLRLRQIYGQPLPNSVVDLVIDFHKCFGLDSDLVKCMLRAYHVARDDGSRGESS